MFTKFNKAISNILNDRFDQIPINLNVYYIPQSKQYVIIIDQDDEGKLVYNQNKQCLNVDNCYFNTDIDQLCKLYINQYNNDNNVLFEDGEGGGAVVDGGGENSTGGTTTGSVSVPEINSTTVGSLYVPFVKPGALPYFKFRRVYGKKDNKKKN